MRLRPAVAADAGAIAALWNPMIRDTLSTFTTVEKTPEDIRAMIAARKDAFLVARERDGCVGFVTFGPFRAGPGYAATVEHTVIVSDSAQARGTGRALLSAAEDAARQQGHHVMIAGISHTNEGAQRFHRRLGYTEVARMPQVGRKADQWLDLVLMQKIL
ncbi:GNAT family N-acetyltransferase [uncultured Roseobacter sp.]|uniref:GNAT family N-acetyltransferase n=1 Tax=uncultured Roseobacter sp. TaxID=114847 RepID=UPI002615C415|nr:GNAT family N-acetyltransferase [uncultured Roseobacter sp.]